MIENGIKEYVNLNAKNLLTRRDPMGASKALQALS